MKSYCGRVLGRDGERMARQSGGIDGRILFHVMMSSGDPMEGTGVSMDSNRSIGNVG